MRAHKERLVSTLQGRGYSHRTVESYVMWMEKLSSHFPGRQLNKLGPADILHFLQFLKERGYADQSLKSARAGMKFIFGEIIIQPSIVSALPKAKRAVANPFIPSQKDIISVVSHVEDETLKAAYGCLYGMGLELLEVLDIKVRHVDLDRWQIKINPRRTQKSRLAAIPVPLREKIASLSKGKGKDALVFTDSAGKRIHEQRLQRVWSEARDKCGAPKDLTMRSLRHAYVMHLTMLGFQLGDILAHLGYHKASALEYYCRKSDIEPNIYSPYDVNIEEQPHTKLTTQPYVAASRISEISQLESNRFDYSKLVGMLRELNFAHLNGCNFSIAFLVRAIIDHVPPLFAQPTFAQVASNYGGAKSFKKNMGNLENALRNISDGLLHNQMRSREDMPTENQVEFRQQLDQLLGEIIRISKKNV
jgi:site-specific recombinase XerD